MDLGHNLNLNVKYLFILFIYFILKNNNNNILFTTLIFSIVVIMNVIRGRIIKKWTIPIISLKISMKFKNIYVEDFSFLFFEK